MKNHLKFRRAKLFLFTLISLPHYGHAKSSYPIDLTKPYIIKELYQLMKDVDELFAEHKIQYWANGGTLIGLLHHKGIIPWDDDLDICIFQDDLEKLLTLKPLLSQLGYSLEKIWWGYKIIAPHCFLDIFPMIKQNNHYVYADKKFRRWWKRDKKPLFYTEEELLPLTRYPFGEIEIYGAHNPYPFLDYGYPGWRTIARFKIDHVNNHYHPDFITLTEEDKVPAQPTGPLKDHVSILLGNT